MKDELEQYCNSLADKDDNKVKYYLNITAVNSQNGITAPLVSMKQMGQKATGAELFREAAEKAESRHYDSLVVDECGADGNIVVSNTFSLVNTKKKNNKRNMPLRYGGSSMPMGLGAFEEQLNTLGFANGLAGVIDASARAQTTENELRRSEKENNELKSKIAELESKCEKYRDESEGYKERYKEISDDMKDMKRDYENKIDTLNRNLSFGTLGANALMGIVAKKVNLDGYLAGMMGGAPEGMAQMEQQPAASQPGIDLSKFDEQTQEYLSIILATLNNSTSSEIKKITGIFQFFGKSVNNLDIVHSYCKQLYHQNNKEQEQQEESNGTTDI